MMTLSEQYKPSEYRYQIHQILLKRLALLLPRCFNVICCCLNISTTISDIELSIISKYINNKPFSSFVCTFVPSAQGIMIPSYGVLRLNRSGSGS